VEDSLAGPRTAGVPPVPARSQHAPIGTGGTPAVPSAAGTEARSTVFASRLGAGVLAVLVFATALAIRLPDLDKFATIDESRWIQRGADFWTAMQRGDSAATFLIGHPGVTTMWLVCAGMGQERVTQMATRPGLEDVTRRSGYLEALVSARRAFVLLGAGVLAIVSLLVWRLVGPGVAALTGLLLAADPFLAAHGQVAHLDATLTGFMTIAILSALIYGLRGGGFVYLALAGAATGLALLTKAPSVLLLPAVPLLAAIPRPWSFGKIPAGEPRRMVMALLGWGAIAIAMVLILWPAFRADPIGTFQQLIQFASRVGGGEHDNFFMGRATDDPGLSYYPTMLVFRLGLGTLVGIVLLAIARRRPEWRHVLIATSAFVLAFVLMMNLGPKKFDRYLLPIFPILAIWAALGWRGLLGRPGMAIPLKMGLVGLLVLLQLGPTLLVRPYYLSYFNPLMGGGAAAQQQVLVGWGEGMAPMAAYLNEKPIIIGAPTVASSYHRVLQAHLEGSALPIERIGFADYVVPYVNTIQRGLENDILGEYLQSQRPEFSVWHNGIEYARVYHGPHFPTTRPIGAQLGDATLVEAVVAPGSLVTRQGENIDALLRWREAAGSGVVAVRLVGSDGRAVVTENRRIGEDGRGGNRGGADDQVADLHTLVVPRDAPPGAYRLVAGYEGGEIQLADVKVESAGR
jgi:hypothetical protein